MQAFGNCRYFPSFHQGESQQLLLIRDLPEDSRLLALRLWKTEYRIANQRSPLWVGNVSYLFVDTRLRLLRFLRTDADFNSALDLFSQDIGNVAIQRVQRELPAGADKRVTWDGGGVADQLCDTLLHRIPPAG